MIKGSVDNEQNGRNLYDGRNNYRRQTRRTMVVLLDRRQAIPRSGARYLGGLLYRKCGKKSAKQVRWGEVKYRCAGDGWAV